MMIVSEGYILRPPHHPTSVLIATSCASMPSTSAIFFWTSWKCCDDGESLSSTLSATALADWNSPSLTKGGGVNK